MGKGFKDYMVKKYFHPNNPDNLRKVAVIYIIYLIKASITIFLKVYDARQKAEAEAKRQQELGEQYQREQEIFRNK